MLGTGSWEARSTRSSGKSGNFCGIGQGSIDWPAVCQALDDVGYDGWLTDESGGEWTDLNRRFDLLIAGKSPGQRDCQLSKTRPNVSTLATGT